MDPCLWVQDRAGHFYIVDFTWSAAETGVRESVGFASLATCIPKLGFGMLLGAFLPAKASLCVQNPDVGLDNAENQTHGLCPYTWSR